MGGSPRVMLYITMGDEIVIRIMLPRSLSPAFFLPDINLVNQNDAKYALYLHQLPDPPYLGYYEKEHYS